MWADAAREASIRARQGLGTLAEDQEALKGMRGLKASVAMDRLHAAHQTGVISATDRNHLADDAALKAMHERAVALGIPLKASVALGMLDMIHKGQHFR